MDYAMSISATKGLYNKPVYNHQMSFNEPTYVEYTREYTKSKTSWIHARVFDVQYS